MGYERWHHLKPESLQLWSWSRSLVSKSHRRFCYLLFWKWLFTVDFEPLDTVQWHCWPSAPMKCYSKHWWLEKTASKMWHTSLWWASRLEYSRHKESDVSNTTLWNIAIEVGLFFEDYLNFEAFLSCVVPISQLRLVLNSRIEHIVLKWFAVFK